MAYKTFINPSGFIEQHYIGDQTPDSVIAAVKELIKTAKEAKANNQEALILVDVTDVPKIDISGKMLKARRQAVKAMMDAEYDRVAVYGNSILQALVNTLAMIAGKNDKVRVFSKRVDALRWLKGGI